MVSEAAILQAEVVQLSEQSLESMAAVILSYAEKALKPKKPKKPKKLKKKDVPLVFVAMQSQMHSGGMVGTIYVRGVR